MAEPKTLDEQLQWERDYLLQRKDKDGNLKVDKLGNKKIETVRKEYEEYEKNYNPNAHLSLKHRKIAEASRRKAAEEAAELAKTNTATTVVTFGHTAEMILPPPDTEKGAVKPFKEQTETNEKELEEDKNKSENPPKT